MQYAINPEDMASGDCSSEIEVNVLGADWWLCLRDEGILLEFSTLRVSTGTGVSGEIRARCC